MSSSRGRTLAGIFVNMGGDRLSVHRVLRHTILIGTHRSDDRERAGVDLLTSIGDDAHHDLSNREC